MKEKIQLYEAYKSCQLLSYNEYTLYLILIIDRCSICCMNYEIVGKRNGTKRKYWEKRWNDVNDKLNEPLIYSLDKYFSPK